VCFPANSTLGAERNCPHHPRTTGASLIVEFRRSFADRRHQASKFVIDERARSDILSYKYLEDLRLLLASMQVAKATFQAALPRHLYPDLPSLFEMEKLVMTCSKAAKQQASAFGPCGLFTSTPRCLFPPRVPCTRHRGWTQPFEDGVLALLAPPYLSFAFVSLATASTNRLRCRGCAYGALLVHSHHTTSHHTTPHHATPYTTI
jgi:hypothetical protein